MRALKMAKGLLLAALLAGAMSMSVCAAEPVRSSEAVSKLDGTADAGKLMSAKVVSSSSAYGWAVNHGALLRGLDISHHQGKINWAKVAKSNVDYVIIRVGYRGNKKKYDDRQWVNNVKGCVKYGIPFGVYIYSHANSVSDAKSEVNHVLRQLGNYKPAYPVYFDMEDKDLLVKYKSGSKKGKVNKSETRKLAAKLATTFCNAIEAKGYEAGIYANTSWFNTYLTDPCFNNWTKWVAQYNTYCAYEGSNMDMWQYSSSGYVSGIKGKNDMNYCLTDKWQNKPFTGKKSVVRVPTISVGFGRCAVDSIQVKWERVFGDIEYKIYKSTSMNGSYKHVKTVTSGNILSWADTDVNSGQEYYYKIRVTRKVNGKNHTGSYSGIGRAYTKSTISYTGKMKKTAWMYKGIASTYGKSKKLKKNAKLTILAKTYDKKGKVWYRIKYKKSKKYYYGYIQSSKITRKRV